MRSKELKNFAFVEAHHIGPRQRPTSVFLKASFTTSRKGAANGIAQAWHNPNNKVSSCHYVLDEAQTLRCLPAKRSSFPINGLVCENAISITVCYDPPDVPTPDMLQKTAKLVAQLCHLYNIKPIVLDDNQFNKWLKHRWRRHGGIYLRNLWGVSEEAFLDLVQSEYASL